MSKPLNERKHLIKVACDSAMRLSPALSDAVLCDVAMARIYHELADATGDGQSYSSHELYSLIPVVAEEMRRRLSARSG